VADGTLDVIVRFIGDASKLQSESQKVDSGMSAIGKTAKTLALGVGAAFATHAVVDWIGEAENAQAVSAKLGQTLSNAGDSSGAWAKQAESLAGSLQKQTGIDDEVIKGGQAILATFHDVSGAAGQQAGIFDEATKAAVDLSAAGFGSVDSAATMLGKALQDPVKGITALSRAGVQFTDDQKAQIKALTESGQALEAQKIILGEVESQVGGTAAASATAGAKMAASFGDAKESIGAALLPVLEQLAPILQKIAGFVEQNATWLVPLAGAVLAVVAAVKAWTVVQTIINVLMTANPIGIIIVAIGALIAIIVLLVTHWDEVAAVASAAWDVIVGAAQAAFGWIRDHWPLILGILLGPIAGAVALIVTHWDTIKSALGSAISAMRGLWDAFVGFVTGIPGRILAALAAVGGYIVDAFRSGIDRIQGLLETVVSWFRELPGRIVSALAGLAGQLYNVGVDWMESLLRGITSMGGRIIDKAKSIASDAISFLNPFDSPDTKAFYTGQAVVADYVRGIESRRAQAIGALATIGARATPAASVGAGGRVELVRIDVHVDASALTPGPAIGRAVADALDAFYRTSGARKRVA